MSADPNTFLTADGQWLRLPADSLADPAAASRPAMFLDRDGVIIEDRDYLRDPNGVALIAGCAQAICAAHRQGLAVVVVSNQSGIARGYFGWTEHLAVEDRMLELLAADNAHVDALLACPCHPAGQGRYGIEHPWRKPAPGMLLAAAAALDLDLSRSFLVGDKASDIEAARAAGLPRAVHVLTGQGGAERGTASALARTGFDVVERASVAGCLAVSWVL